MTGIPPRHEPIGRPHRAPDGADHDALRSLRRWVLVAGVWAVAATAIALIALLDRSEGDARKEADAATRRIAATERKLDARIDGLEERLDDLPRSEDVSRLQERLSRAETGASEAGSDAKRAQDKLAELEKRVQTVEDDRPDPDAGDRDGEP